jgi:hypothetical protein
MPDPELPIAASQRVISVTLTASSEEVLNARWHDQPLDLQSLKFDQASRECVFLVLERTGNDSSRSMGFVQRSQLQWCRVTANNITNVQVSGAKGEVELYMVEVQTTPNRLAIKCVNGMVELFGHGIIVTIEEDSSKASDETQVTFTTPLGSLSWRKKQTRPES